MRRPCPGAVGPNDATAHLTVWRRGATDVVPLTQQRVTLGRGASNDVALWWDPKVSHVHAVLERVASGWTIRDVGSRNGTFLNGERTRMERVIRPGDELRLGDTRLLLGVVRPTVDQTTTEFGEPPPELTEREKAVLLALCRPIDSGNMLTEPATMVQIASAPQGSCLMGLDTFRSWLHRLRRRFLTGHSCGVSDRAGWPQVGVSEDVRDGVARDL